MPGVVTKAVTRRVAIEQCIARGETVIDICKQLRVSEDDVCDVWLRMDRINEQPDYALPPTHRRRCAS